MTRRRPPRHYPLDVLPTDDPGHYPLYPPTWVQAIGQALECQGSSHAVTTAIAGYFAALEMEAVPVPRVTVWQHGWVNIDFETTDPCCQFSFRGQLDLITSFRAECGQTTQTPPMRFLMAVEQGREVLGLLYPALACWAARGEAATRGFREFWRQGCQGGCAGSRDQLAGESDREGKE
jgi:hypothetical protein